MCNDGILLILDKFTPKQQGNQLYSSLSLLLKAQMLKQLKWHANALKVQQPKIKLPWLSNRTLGDTSATVGESHGRRTINSINLEVV